MELGSARSNLWDVTDTAIDLARQRRPQHRLRIEARPKALTIDAAATALIVIDMQNFFCHPSRAAGADESPTARPIAPLTALLPQLRAWEMPVLWVNWGNRADKLNLSPNILYPFHRTGGIRPPLIDKDSWEAEVVAPLAPGDDDIRIDKYRISGFWDTPLDSVLRNLRITTLLFAGVNLDQCVFATLLDASCLGYDCILLADCASTRSPHYCTQATHYNIEHGLGFITDSKDLLAAQKVSDG